jgi:phosphatidate cytidylyltransferase
LTNISAASAVTARLPDEDAISVLMRRILSALVLIPLAVIAVLLGGWWFAGAVLVLAAIVLFEWYRLTGAKALWAASAALIAVWLSVAYHQSIGLAGYILVMGAIGSAFLCLVRGGEPQAGWAGAGLVYVCVPMIALLWLIGVSGGSLLVLWLLIVVWASDTGAFAVGRLIGGPKLAPAISPAKTWAGAVGGLLAAVAVSVVMAGRILPMDLAQAVTFAVIVGVTAQLGDLGQSWIKRRFKAKDSGMLIPGHGGVMDRVDGLVPAAAVFALIVAFCPGLAGGMP